MTPIATVAALLCLRAEIGEGGSTRLRRRSHHNAPPDNDTLNLRAERSGKGDGRVYTVCFGVNDPEQSANGCVTVMVPHDKKTDPAKNSGGAYNSTK